MNNTDLLTRATETFKRCPGCGEAKLREAFSPNKSQASGYNSWCKDCSNRARKVRYAADPLKSKSQELMYSHGITLAEYNDMLAAQGGLCAVNDADCVMHRGRLYLPVDHCHTTKKIRGLLCDFHNIGLGRHEKKMSPAGQKRAAKYNAYLLKHNQSPEKDTHGKPNLGRGGKRPSRRG